MRTGQSKVRVDEKNIFLPLRAQTPPCGYFFCILSNSHTSNSTINKTSEAEGTVGSDLESDDEDPEKNAFFTPKKDSRFDDGEKNPWKLGQGNHFYHFSIACAFLTTKWGILRSQILCQATHEGTNAIFQTIFDHFHTKFTCNSRIIRSPNPIPECSSFVTNSFCPILPHFTPFWTLICHFLMFLPRLGLVTLIAASTRTSIRIHLCPYF